MRTINKNELTDFSTLGVGAGLGCYSPYYRNLRVIKWYTMAESYGVYPFGRDIQGVASGYKSNISSKGTGLLGLKYATAKSSQQLWNHYADNVFNLSFVQTGYQLPVGEHVLLLGAQGVGTETFYAS